MRFLWACGVNTVFAKLSDAGVEVCGLFGVVGGQPAERGSGLFIEDC